MRYNEANIYYVYELINHCGTVEKVGETKDVENRIKQHTKLKSSAFYGRQDLILNVVTSFNTRKEAWQFQIKLQKEYGMNTDLDHCIEIGRKHVESGHLASLRTSEHQSKAASSGANKLRTCEYCGKTDLKQVSLNRWHGQRCQNKNNQ